MPARGDCLCCSKIKTCTFTTVEKVQQGYTCHFFSEVSEAEWMARWNSMKKFGEIISIQAMMDRPIEAENEENDDGTDV